MDRVFFGLGALSALLPSPPALGRAHALYLLVFVVVWLLVTR